MIQACRLAKIGLALFTAWLGLVLPGCTARLESRYADHRGASINGVASFIDILRQSGRKVDVWPGVSPRMEMEYNTVIVFQSNYEQLPEKLCLEIQDLMNGGTVNKLVLVVRDSDVAVDYWRQIRDRSESSPKDIVEAGRSYDASLALFAANSQSEFDAKTGTWYGLKRVDRAADQITKSIECHSESGSFSVDARWPFNRRLEPPDSAEILWHSGDDPLLTLEETASGVVIVLGSATPLLNGGLVDAGNRRLAAEFVRWIPKSDRVAVAVSSRWIDDSDLDSPSMVQFLKVHPNGWVFGQAIVALLLFCWWKFPIFGRPRRTTRSETARFGRHVEALGNLLRRSGNVKFAQQRIRDWHGTQKPRSDSDSTLN